MEKRTCSIHQLDANRANAEKSTGPKTEAGKQKASANATRHALTGQQFTLLPDESDAEYQLLLQDLIAEYQPATTTEDILVLKLAQSYWLGQRALRLGLSDMANDKQLALMMRYQSLHDRAFQSALKQLAQLQKVRKAEEREEHLIAAAAKSFDLDTRIVRLDLLRAKRDAFVAQQELADFEREIKRETLDLTRGLRRDSGSPGGRAA